ncbi:DUF4149 domain-containing protein [Aliterella atlantica]|uniref:Membrane protein n=1 Tax=Aliterella atlantica CENA595 TaxID=1618023 RepID=A0A0D8ZWH9_9CYAN|nr:DUF4149 domain-containing protein [Aliterella atlantica]KJH72784.1 membrane protein [Aliterella atlantica CENA595]
MTAVSSLQSKRPIWQTILMLTLGLWLGGSLLLDWVVMPSLYVSGMMTQAGFTTAGYVIFWNFNRLELVAAAIVLTSVLTLNQTAFVTNNWRRGAVILSSLLLAVALVNTYLLTPQMCAIGAQLNLFESVREIPTTMNQLHVAYWFMEAFKLVVGSTLLGWSYKQ